MLGDVTEDLFTVYPELLSKIGRRPEPSAQMRAIATEARELHISLTEVGFTKAEVMDNVRYSVACNMLRLRTERRKSD
jgi:hypothetical protein